MDGLPNLTETGINGWMAQADRDIDGWMAPG